MHVVPTVRKIEMEFQNFTGTMEGLEDAARRYANETGLKLVRQFFSTTSMGTMKLQAHFMNTEVIEGTGPGVRVERFE